MQHKINYVAFSLFIYLFFKTNYLFSHVVINNKNEEKIKFLFVLR